MHRLISRCLPLLLLLGWLGFAGSAALAQQASPFQMPGKPAAAEPASEPGMYERLMFQVRQVQSELYRELSLGVRALKKDYSLSTAWGLIAISLLYGVFHAVGPGHGKAVITSYLLANERAVRQGIVLSLLSSLMQGVTAVVLVVGGAWVFDLAGQRLLDSAWSMEQFSFGLIAAVGLYMIWQVLTGRGHHHHDHDHHEGHGHDHDGHDHSHSHGHDHGHVALPPASGDGQGLTLRRAVPIILAVGIRPCGGALIVLVFALTNGLVFAGIGATFAMSLGTGLTVSVLAILTLTSKGLVLRFARRDMSWAGRIETGLRLFGGLALLAFGALFLLASMGAPRSPFGI
ncbi:MULTISPECIES: nickel/cobalt transporter [unclassified Minwuia]|jgi:nickel/cobalt transporter (NicO) family protein|uniref:nickel/cobalt transporter n=1 Tax=unclassified Minwuia TaxID=2618799 RepID=UPI00247833AC|nr:MULTISPECIES: nickel/cobalt transporter [unclassified Minwuia]